MNLNASPSRWMRPALKWLNDYHARVAKEVRPQLSDNATKLWLDEATAACSS